MNISGITTCVGELYASYLERSLPVWLDTLDSLTVVTSDYTYDVARLEAIYNRHFLTVTDAFTHSGAHFNKGAALNVGLHISQPTDWLLCFDCDILPPQDWRTLTEHRAQPDSLNSARRYNEQGKEIGRSFFPRCGYFHLWHVSDPHYRPFSTQYQDAGGYDTEFANQWPPELHQDLGFRLTHLGTKSRYWCGPNTTPEQQHEAMSRWRARR